MKRSFSVLLAALLFLSAFAGLVPCSSASGANWYDTWYDYHPDFLKRYGPEFDVRKAPDRPMTVEEFICLPVAHYWYPPINSVDVSSVPRDKDGDLPSSWAMPLVAMYSWAFDAERLDYTAPATLGFMMQYFARLRGRYSFDAVNVHYSFTGVEDYTVEEKLLLCVAIDYGVVPYTPGMDVSEANLLLRDVMPKYKPPEKLDKLVQPKVQLAKSYPWSMVFFEDTYHYYDDQKEVRARQELDQIKAAGNSINMVNLNVQVMDQDGSAGHFILEDRVCMKQAHLDLLDYCKANGIKILCGVLNYYEERSLKALKNNPSKIPVAADELVGYVMKYDFDGLDLDLEMFDNTYRDVYSALLRSLAQKLHSKGKLLVATVGAYYTDKAEAASLYDYRVLAETCDLVTVILYDDHSVRAYKAGGEVGALSHYVGIRRRLTYALSILGPEKTMLSFGTYGVDFNLAERNKTKALLRQEILALIAKTGAQPATHDPANTINVDDTYFSYQDEYGAAHDVYYDSDAALFRRIDYAAQYGLAGVCSYYALSDSPEVYRYMGSRLVELPFRDVENNWAYPPIKWAVENGITNGTSATTFSPEKTCTRGQVVTFLWRAKGSPAPESTENPFTDVSPSDYYYQAVLWAKEAGITAGTSADKFSPDAGCTRAQVVTFLWRCEGKPEPAGADNPFSDVLPGQYYTDAILWAVENNITNGTSATAFSPGRTCTRAQIVTFLYRDLT